MPKYPQVEVQLTGEDSNIFFVIGKVRQAMRQAGISQEEAQKFTSEATSGDYDNGLATCMKWVTVK